MFPSKLFAAGPIKRATRDRDQTVLTQRINFFAEVAGPFSQSSDVLGINNESKCSSPAKTRGGWLHGS
jgi:hypothetical protein